MKSLGKVCLVMILVLFILGALGAVIERARDQVNIASGQPVVPVQALTTVSPSYARECRDIFRGLTLNVYCRADGRTLIVTGAAMTDRFAQALMKSPFSKATKAAGFSTLTFSNGRKATSYSLDQ